MSFTCTLFCDKGRCFNQSERGLYGNFVIKQHKVYQQLPYELNSEELICTKLQKGHGHGTDELSDYDEDNVPFERLEKMYVPAL